MSKVSDRADSTSRRGLFVAALFVATALSAGEMDRPAAVVEGMELRVKAWPGENFAIGDGLEYLGSRAFRLYDVSDAEIHVFVERGEGAAVKRLLWVQLEQVLDSSDHVYDYSDLPLRFEIAALDFVADTRFGRGYTLESVDGEGDVAQVLQLLLAAHDLHTPEEMMRLRMVTLDESGRREMLAIYLEDLGTRGLSISELEGEPGLWSETRSDLHRRALEILRAAD